MVLCTWLVLVHYDIVVNPYRPIREPVSEPYKLVYTDLFSKYTAMLEKIMVGGGGASSTPRLESGPVSNFDCEKG